MMIIVVFDILFANMGLRTIKREIIKSSSYSEVDIYPSEMTFKTSPKSMDGEPSE